MYLYFVVLKIEFLRHRQVIEDIFEQFYLVECKSGTSGKENWSSSSLKTTSFSSSLIECHFTSIQWHSNTVVVINVTSFSCFGDQGTSGQVDGQWFIENSPHYCFVTGWGSQTTFISKFWFDDFRSYTGECTDGQGRWKCKSTCRSFRSFLRPYRLRWIRYYQHLHHSHIEHMLLGWFYPIQILESHWNQFQFTLLL